MPVVGKSTYTARPITSIITTIIKCVISVFRTHFQVRAATIKFKWLSLSPVRLSSSLSLSRRWRRHNQRASYSILLFAHFYLPRAYEIHLPKRFEVRARSRHGIGHANFERVPYKSAGESFLFLLLAQTIRINIVCNDRRRRRRRQRRQRPWHSTSHFIFSFSKYEHYTHDRLLDVCAECAMPSIAVREHFLSAAAAARARHAQTPTMSNINNS